MKQLIPSFFTFQSSPRQANNFFQIMDTERAKTYYRIYRQVRASSGYEIPRIRLHVHPSRDAFCLGNVQLNLFGPELLRESIHFAEKQTRPPELFLGEFNSQGKGVFFSRHLTKLWHWRGERVVVIETQDTPGGFESITLILQWFAHKRGIASYEIRKCTNIFEWIYGTQNSDDVRLNQSSTSVPLPKLAQWKAIFQEIAGLYMISGSSIALLGPQGLGKTAYLNQLAQLTWILDACEALENSRQWLEPAIFNGRAGNNSSDHLDELLQWRSDEIHRWGSSEIRNSIEWMDRSPLGLRTLFSGNLCNCGGWPRDWDQDGHQGSCFCNDSSVQNVRKKLMGPQLDRVPLVIPSREKIFESKNHQKPTQISIQTWVHWRHEYRKKMNPLSVSAHETNENLREIQQIQQLQLALHIRHYSSNPNFNADGLANYLRSRRTQIRCPTPLPTMGRSTKETKHTGLINKNVNH